MVSTLAVLVSLVAMLVAWRALDQAQDARDIALVGRAPAMDAGEASDGPTSGPTSAVPTTAGRRTPASPSAGAEPPELNPRTAYELKYEKQSLVLPQAPQCNDPTYLDLDEPRAHVPREGSDLRYVVPCNTAPVVSVGTSAAGAPGMTPQDCAEKIRTEPIGQVGVPVTKGLVLCTTTSFQEAQARGDVQRMVLVEITGIAPSGAVSFLLTAWNIPG